MPIDLVWREQTPESPWQAGEAFFAPYRYDLSAQYLIHVALIRPPIMVMLPMRGGSRHAVQFIIDSHPTGKLDECWAVTVDMATLIDGERPDITVAPSIDVKGLYHGFVQHGVISDDIGS